MAGSNRPVQSADAVATAPTAPRRSGPVARALAPVRRLGRIALAVVQHRQVVGGEEAAATADRVVELRLLADLERAQPARLDHRQQLGRARRRGDGEVEQEVAEGEEEVGRALPARHLALGQRQPGLEAAELLEREHRPQDEVVAPRGALVGAGERALVVRPGRREERAQLAVLAELVVKIGVVGRLVEGERQQLLVAARLLRLVRVEVAVVRDDEVEAAPRQHRIRLLVDAAGVADAARQHARQPARRVADAAVGIVERAGDADLADELRRQAAQRRERVGAGGDPLVRIEHQAPGRLGQRQRGVARGREVVAPREAGDARAEAARDLGRRIARAGVDDDDLVDPCARALEAALEAALLVANDHHQGEGIHGLRRSRAQARRWNGR